MATGADIVRIADEVIATSPVPVYKSPCTASPDDAHPVSFDCSGLVAWVSARAGVPFGPVAGAFTVDQHLRCRQAGRMIPLERAATIPGALLFRHRDENKATVEPVAGVRPASSHVGISRGDGKQSIEAVGSDLGCRADMHIGQPQLQDRWTHAALIPGVQYPTFDYAPPVSEAPERLLDTRPASRIGYDGVKPAGGDQVTVPVLGRGGVPAGGVIAVVLNVTATEATGAGFVTVFPSGAQLPTASHLNLERQNDTETALVTVPVGGDGAVTLFTQQGAHFIADVAAWFMEGEGFTPLVPTRILDTRPGSLIGYSGFKPGPGASVEVPVLGRADVPAAGVVAAVLTVTATEATAPGYVTVYPSDVALPTASNLNLRYPGHTIANQVIVPVGANGTVKLFTQAGTHVIVDISGYFIEGSVFRSLAPDRILDTRPGPARRGHTGGAPGPGAQVRLQVLGRGGVPAGGVELVALNVTATNSAAPGYIATWPAGSEPRTAAILNLTENNLTVPNLVVVRVGDDGGVVLFTQASADLLADVVGWMASSRSG